jgi:hypothetical protein
MGDMDMEGCADQQAASKKYNDKNDEVQRWRRETREEADER